MKGFKITSKKVQPFTSRKVGKFSQDVLIQEENRYPEPYYQENQESQESYDIFNGVHTDSSAKRANTGDSRTNGTISNGESSVDNMNSKSG